METLTKQTRNFAIAEVDLVYRSKVNVEKRPKITCSADAFKQLIPFYDPDKIELQEEFKVLLLNPSNRILGMYPMSVGGIMGTVADVRMIFIAALRAKATAIIVAHNHPSGKLRPSEADKVITKKMAAAGEFLEIEVIDHLILSKDKYFSFADEGLL